MGIVEDRAAARYMASMADGRRQRAARDRMRCRAPDPVVIALINRTVARLGSGLSPAERARAIAICDRPPRPRQQELGLEHPT